MRKVATIGLSVLALFAIACGVDTGTDSTVGGDSSDPAVVDTGVADQGPVTAAMGQTVTLSNTLFGNTTKVEVTLSDPRQDTSSSIFGPENGMYYAVNVTVVCVEGSFTSNPGSFKFVGPDGSVYDWAITSGYDPTLSFTELNAGQRTSGWVVFDVAPAAVAGGKVQLDGIGLDYDEPAAYWAV